MEKLRARWQMSFSSKVLTPVIASMVLLLAITVWTVNVRLTQQFQTEAARCLATADGVFRNSQKLHAKNLMLRYRNLPNEPRYKQLFEESDPGSIREALAELLGEQDVDIILFTTDQTELLACARRDPLLSISEFEANSFLAVKRALTAEERADTVIVGGRLFDVVSIPVFGARGRLIGALTLGSEFGEAAAQEFSLLTDSQIVLLANDRIIVSTIGNSEARAHFAGLFKASTGALRKPEAVRNVRLGEEHYFCTAGTFTTLNGDGQLGYLLLTSYETSLRNLRSTRQMVFLISAVGMILGSAAVWWLVRKVTQPLRQLRDTAEAVGRGDFSRRVQVRSRDECGELATVFNRMTENLKNSREQLELTVETLKTTQAQLVQSEKLSGIGEFVAGVAHELNNPLTSVMGFSELLKNVDKNPQHRRYIDMIHKSALRCQKIVQALLSFARRHVPERKLSNLNELVEAAMEILHYQMRTSNIECTAFLDANLPKALVDPHQVQQVFLNIINNARQALEGQRAKGSVRITTEVRDGKIRVIFEDNGPGIAEANLSKVFDPFFTTKEVGKGTGLGLSLCYGIIKEHGGTISVTSKIGQGATFVVELPLAAQTEPTASKTETSPVQAAEPAAVTPLVNGREGLGKKILVIDDEEPILHMVREALAEHGYEVDIARDGESALRNVSQRCYDLALCDWKMPGLNGEQVYERIRASNPALSERMIFITGDVINDRTRQFLQERKKLCLSKPFSLTEFRSAISKAMAR
jgi:signal transduction histidine kinase